jgi:hypothetical protein
MGEQEHQVQLETLVLWEQPEQLEVLALTEQMAQQVQQEQLAILV